MNLEEHFSKTLKALTELELEADIEFTSRILGTPSSLTTNSIRCFVAHHHYGPIKIRMVDLFASKSALRALGLMVFSVLLSEVANECVLMVSEPIRDNPESNWVPQTRLLIQKPLPLEVDACSVVTQSKACTYSVRSVRKHPWIGNLPQDPWNLPTIGTRDLEDVEGQLARLQSSETITGFGSIEACVRMANLFLNLGHPNNEVVECCLEGEPGFRGVSPQSAELRIHLPASFHWKYRDSR